MARRSAQVLALVALLLAVRAPAAAAQGFDPVCGLKAGPNGCGQPAPPTTVAPVPAPTTTTTAPPVENEEPVDVGEPLEAEEPGTVAPAEEEPPTTVAPIAAEDATEPEATVEENPSEVAPPEDETSPIVDTEGEPAGTSDTSEEAILIASGLLLLLLSAASRVRRRARARRATEAAAPTIDATGEPLIVQDGRYRGGRRGDVWWNGEWISPDEADRRIAEQRRVLERAAHFTTQPDGPPRPDRLLPTEAAAQAGTAAAQAARRARAQRLFHAERLRDTGLDIAHVEGQSARDFENYRSAWDWGGWLMDRGIDALAPVAVGEPGAKVVKGAYTVLKSTAEGLTEDFRADEQDSVRIGKGTVGGMVRGVAEAGADYYGDKFKEGATNELGRTKAAKAIKEFFEEAPSPRRSPKAREVWRGLGKPAKGVEVTGDWTGREVWDHLKGDHTHGGRAVVDKAMRDAAEEAVTGGIEDTIKQKPKEWTGIKRAGLDPE